MSKPKKLITAKRAYLQATSRAKEDARRRALDAVATKRQNPALSMTAATRQSGTTLKTARKYAGQALAVRSGRLDVTPSDRLKRPMRMLTPKGEVVVVTTSSRAASRIGRYNNAVRQYLVTGDPEPLKPFSGKAIRSGGERYEFVTDRRTLDKLARAGVVHFLDIYAPEAGS
ncbi:MAG TPA: hypothetical protein VNF68_07295 [Candidatus Baltobacteraceae bacterium]|nr:hypothetical protein [Candidatus Baltobacteraceae bacterium]